MIRHKMIVLFVCMVWLGTRPTAAELGLVQAGRLQSRAMAEWSLWATVLRGLVATTPAALPIRSSGL